MFTDLLSGLNSLHPHQETSCDGERLHAPPMWLVARAKDEKFNFFKFSRYLQKKVGGIFSGDISRLQSLSTPNLKLSPVCLLS